MGRLILANIGLIVLYRIILKSSGRRGLYDVTITHLHDSFTHRGSFRIVSDHDDGLIEPIIKLLKHVEDES